LTIDVDVGGTGVVAGGADECHVVVDHVEDAGDNLELIVAVVSAVLVIPIVVAIVVVVVIVVSVTAASVTAAISVVEPLSITVAPLSSHAARAHRNGSALISSRLGTRAPSSISSQRCGECS